MKAILLAPALAVISLFAFDANAFGHGSGGGGHWGGGGGHFSGGHFGHGGFCGHHFHGCGFGGWGGGVGWYGWPAYYGYGGWGGGYGYTGYGGYDYSDYGAGDAVYYPQQNPGLATNSLAREVQQSLAMAGYYHGSVDGHLGPLSREAIGRYQTNHHLPVTNRIDESLLQSLHLL